MPPPTIIPQPDNKAQVRASDLNKTSVSVHVGAKKPGFSYRKTSLAAEKRWQAILLCLWSTKNPVSGLPPERIQISFSPGLSSSTEKQHSCGSAVLRWRESIDSKRETTRKWLVSLNYVAMNAN